MALAILDGTQTATTLSTILSSGQHITAHTVVSLGSQAISDITSAVSSGISISGTVTANLGLMQSVVATEGITASSQFVKIGGHQDGSNATAHIAHVSSGGALKVDGSGSTQPISGTVTIGNTVTIAGTVTANPTGTQTIAGSVTIGAGTSQIGSVTASISGTVPVSGTFFQATQPVSLATLPSLVAGTAQIGSVTASISGTIPVSISSVTIGNSITISNFPATQPISISSITIGNSLTIGSIVTHGVTIANTSVTVNGTFFQATQPISISSVTIGNSVTIGLLPDFIGGGYSDLFALSDDGNLYVQANVTNLPSIPAGTNQIGSVTASLAVGTNRIGVVTIGGGTVTIGAGTAQIGVVTIGNIRRSTDGATTQLNTEVGSGYLEVRSYIGAGTAQIGSVTASISGTVPISISSVTIGNSITIGSLPAISGTVTASLVAKDYLGGSFLPLNIAGQEELFGNGARLGVAIIGPAGDEYGTNVPLNISGTVTANTFAVQGTAVTTSNFTSTTPSTVLANFNATREVLTIFNEGAGNLHICGGATCTTIAYQVRLSAGDYYEVPNHQTTITHSAVFATAGTARVTQVS